MQREFDYPDPDWCPYCGELRDICESHGGCVEPSDWEDYDSYCEMCGGEGVIITCCDDICVGGGHCIHGDGEEMCPACLGGY